MQPVAASLDNANGTEEYSATVAAMSDRLHDSSLTPAAILLDEMTQNNETYYRLAMRKAREHREHFRSKALETQAADEYRRLAEESKRKQQQIEAADTLSFDDFLASYYQ